MLAAGPKRRLQRWIKNKKQKMDEDEEEEKDGDSE